MLSRAGWATATYWRLDGLTNRDSPEPYWTALKVERDLEQATARFRQALETERSDKPGRWKDFRLVEVTERKRVRLVDTLGAPL